MRTTGGGIVNCLIVVPSLTRAGAETQSVELANGLASRGQRVHVLAFERQLDLRSRLAGNVAFHHVLRRSKVDWKVVCAVADVTSPVLYVPMEFAGSDGNSTTNPSCGCGYSFHAAAPERVTTTSRTMIRAMMRKAHLPELCRLGDSWYKNSIVPGNTINDHRKTGAHRAPLR